MVHLGDCGCEHLDVLFVVIAGAKAHLDVVSVLLRQLCHLGADLAEVLVEVFDEPHPTRCQAHRCGAAHVGPRVRKQALHRATPVALGGEASDVVSPFFA